MAVETDCTLKRQPESANDLLISTRHNSCIGMDLVRKGVSLAQDPNQIRWIGPLLVLADAALSFLIVQYIPCTCCLSLHRDHQQVLH